MFYFILTAVFGCRTRLFVVAAACKHKYISKQQLTANNNKSNSSNFHQTNNIQIHDIYTYVANTQNYSKYVCIYIYLFVYVFVVQARAIKSQLTSQSKSQTTSRILNVE